MDVPLTAFSKRERFTVFLLLCHRCRAKPVSLLKAIHIFPAFERYTLIADGHPTLADVSEVQTIERTGAHQQQRRDLLEVMDGHC